VKTQDRAISELVSAWFDRVARDLPWRVEGKNGRRDAYRSLVSEFMLMQTQVSRVLERFDLFMERFPSVEALAGADEDAVLAAWSGLGYYRRARLLHGAAKMICDEFGGRVPEDAASLRRLPGVGRYTAGAMASIVFGRAEALVDGNVARVLARVDGAAGPVDMERAWRRAGEMVAQAKRPGVLNEGLMELGATVCTPRSPGCERCPLLGLCRARAMGLESEIPEPKAGVTRRALFAATVVAQDGRGRVLVEQRAEKGLWAKMWQPPTIEGDKRHARPGALAAMVKADSIERVGSFEFVTTHRLVHFTVYRGLGARAGEGRRWVSRRALAQMALSNAHRRVFAEAGVEMAEAVSSRA
jgi:A/G-specific adenine glycosylase